MKQTTVNRLAKAHGYLAARYLRTGNKGLTGLYLDAVRGLLKDRWTLAVIVAEHAAWSKYVNLHIGEN